MTNSLEQPFVLRDMIPGFVGGMSEVVRIKESKARFQGAQKGWHKKNITLTPYLMQERPTKGKWTIKIQDSATATTQEPAEDKDEQQLQPQEKDSQYWQVDGERMYFEREEYAKNFLESFKAYQTDPETPLAEI